MLFSDKTIAQLHTNKGALTRRDPDNVGLAISVLPTGTRTFLYIRKVDGRTKQTSLGRHPEVSVEAARAKYRQLITRPLLDPSLDPLLDPMRHTIAPQIHEDYPLKQAWRDFEVNEGRERLSKVVLQQYGGLLYEFIDIRGNVGVASITPRLMREYLREFNHMSAKPNKIKAAFSCLFRYLVDNDRVEANPCVGLPTKACKPRIRKFSTQEIKLVLPALQLSHIEPVNKSVIQLMLLTLARVSEVVDMEIAELELDANRWILPASRSKNGREHLIPLSPAAKAILEAHISKRKAGLVFIHTSGLGANRWAARQALVRLTEQVGIPPATSHDLRRTAAHHINSLGVPSDMISRLMNHAAQGVTARHYIQASLFDYEREKHEVLCLWATALAGWGL